jgi:hypothetical protein
MTRIRVTALALCTLLLPASIAYGQQPIGNVAAARCQPAPSTSRARKSDPAECAEGTVVRVEQPLNITLEVPQPEALQCAATALSEYTQRNNVAHLTVTISNASCPAGSAGTFDVVARVKDESGEVKALEFPEKWQHGDASDASVIGEYPIGENVELVSGRVRNSRCTCAAAPEAAPAETPPSN